MNVIQRTKRQARGVLGVLRLVRDPNALGEVFRILDGLEHMDKATEFVDQLRQDPQLRSAFERRPRVGVIDREWLASLPLGTLGRTYADEMRQRGLDPNAIEQRVDDGSDFAFAFYHLRDTHDLWHTLTGFEVDVPGELGLQAFYLAQIRGGLPLLLLGIGFLNTLFFAPEHSEPRMLEIVRGWEMGRRAEPVFGFDWAAHWEVPLIEIRRQLNITVERRTAARAPELSLGL